MKNIRSVQHTGSSYRGQGAGGRDVAAGPALGRRRTGTRQRREYSVATSKVWATAALWEGFQSLRRWGGDEVTARAGLRYNKEVRPYKPGLQSQ